MPTHLCLIIVRLLVAPPSIGQLWLLVLVLLVVVLLLLVVVVLVLVLLLLLFGSRSRLGWSRRGLGQPVQQQAGRQLVWAAELVVQARTLSTPFAVLTTSNHGAV